MYRYLPALLLTPFTAYFIYRKLNVDKKYKLSMALGLGYIAAQLILLILVSASLFVAFIVDLP